MLKRIGLRKIAVTSCALFIIGLFYIFPTAEAVEYKIYNKEKIKTNACIYMNDKNNYVSLVNVNLKEKKLTDKLKESINLLKKDKDNFKSTINKDTKLLNIKIEEDTGYYDDIQEKQISLLNDLVFPFIDEKLKKNSVRVSWNKNLPTDFINSISKALAKRKEKNEEAEKQRIIAERKSKGLCQHCGGTFKGLFSSKCSICGKLKDY